MWLNEFMVAKLLIYNPFKRMANKGTLQKPHDYLFLVG